MPTKSEWMEIITILEKYDFQEQISKSQWETSLLTIDDECEHHYNQSV